MKLRKVSETRFAQVCARLDSGDETRDDVKAAVSHLLAVLEERAPGASVEIRVPPFAVAQCIAGAQHSRGTPPAVVEMDPRTWISLARGQLEWGRATVTASGQRSDLTGVLPLV